jgi:hypothetical protein
MSSHNYNYPQMTTGIGVITPSLWKRLMENLRHYENSEQSLSADLMPESLHSRITDLEMHKPFFFAKLLRAHVLNDTGTTALNNPNVYEYAWVEVRPVTQDPDCCPPCIESRHYAATDWDQAGCCATQTDCTTYLNFQGHWNWWEDTVNTSWGDTLPSTGFELEDMKSDFNPDGYPCIQGQCEPTGEGGFPNILRKPYTKPAMNILESFNTYDNAGGVDQTFGIGDFMMQAIGGGDTQRDHEIGCPTCPNYPEAPECWDPDLGQPPCTQYEFPLKTTPIVLMFNIRESEGTFRQVFQAANSYDGQCVQCS